jgi:hypothetical protein
MDQVLAPYARQDRTAPAVSVAHDSQRDFLRTSHRLPVAGNAVRLTALEDRLSLFLAVASESLASEPLSPANCATACSAGLR